MCGEIPGANCGDVELLHRQVKVSIVILIEHRKHECCISRKAIEYVGSERTSYSYDYLVDSLKFGMLLIATDLASARLING
jgi:hypothetical protein